MPVSTPTISSEITVSGGSSGSKVIDDVQAGDLLVVVAGDVGEASIDFSVDDDMGNEWAQGATRPGTDAGNRASIWWTIAETDGDTTVTVSSSGSTDFVAKVIHVPHEGGTFSFGASSSIYKSSSIGASYPCSADATVIDTTDQSIIFTSAVTDGPGDGGFGTLTANANYSLISTSAAIVAWQYGIFTAPVSNERGTFTSSAGKKAACCIAAFHWAEPPPLGGDEGTGDGYCGPKTLTRVGSEIYESSGTSGSTTVTVGAGDLIVVRVNTLNNVDVDIEVDDDQSGVWREVVTFNAIGSANKASIWACLSAIGGATEITVSVSSACEFLAVVDRGTSEGGTWDVAGWTAIRETTAGTSHTCGSMAVSVPAIIIGNATVDTTSGEVFGEIQNINGEYYCDDASTTQVAHLRRLTSEGAGSQSLSFESANSRATVAVAAAFRTSCETGGCWWPCCGGGGGGVAPEPCTVRKIDDSGVEVWRYNAPLVGGYGDISVDRVNGKVYVAADFSGDGIGRIDADTGALDFSFGDFASLRVVPEDGVVYAPDDSYDLDGTPIWVDLVYATERIAAAPGYLYSSGVLITRVDTSDGSALWSVTGPTNGTSRQAVASSGDLWALESSGGVDPVTLYKYLSSDGTLDDSEDLTTNGLGASGIALDSSDNIFVTTNNAPDSSHYHLAKFNSGVAEQWEVSFPGLYAMNDYVPVCVNRSTGDVYVSAGTEVRKYNSAGAFQWAFDHTQKILVIDCDDDGNVYILGEEAAD